MYPIIIFLKHCLYDLKKTAFAWVFTNELLNAISIDHFPTKFHFGNKLVENLQEVVADRFCFPGRLIFKNVAVALVNLRSPAISLILI